MNCTNESVRVYRWVSALSKGPGFLVLLARGWTLEWIDERYWSVLVSRPEPAEVD